MTKDQKGLLIFQLDNIIDLAEGNSITPEKQLDLVRRCRTYCDTLTTGKKKTVEDTQETSQ